MSAASRASRQSGCPVVGLLGDVLVQIDEGETRDTGVERRRQMRRDEEVLRMDFIEGDIIILLYWKME